MIHLTYKDIALISQKRPNQHVAPFPRPHLEAFESPLRTQMVMQHLNRIGLLGELTRVDAPKAKREDILLAHSPYLLDTVELYGDLGSGHLGESAFASAEVYRAGLYAVGGALRASKMVMEETSSHAYSLLRPPGHHASTSNPTGLCFFNNIAIAVKSAIEAGAERVSIIDFDDHFGNGTAEIFYSNPRVQYISIHEYDFENYGTGHYSEIGYGEGIGTNINIPLLDMSPDISYEAAFDRVVVPAIENFRPDVIAVSAGYDSHWADPVGNMDIDSRTFWKIGRTVRDLVDLVSARGSFWVLEGGYNPLGLGFCVEASIRGLAGDACPPLPDQLDRIVHEMLVTQNINILNRVYEMISPHWQ
ncbi:MAG: histone deacetylase [Candidatus Lokiarchaeota archaeon]|nr:histone deacetylase [Candidatus Lokiarchaeota archaeon]